MQRTTGQAWRLNTASCTVADEAQEHILARNNVHVFGAGAQPMLFAHGFGCDQHMWRFVAPAFAAHYRIILFDYVGSGQADLRAYSPERYGSLHGYAQDVLDICAALNLRDVVFVGHSVSSMIGMLAAIKAPETFACLVLVGPSPRYLNDPPAYSGGFERARIDGLLELMAKNSVGWASLLAQLIIQSPDRPELTSELEECLCATDPLIASRFAAATFLADNRADLPLVRVPSLILQCADDVIAPQAVGEYLHARLPQSTLRQMQAIGHCPQMSHPDETIKLIAEYLAVSTLRAEEN